MKVLLILSLFLFTAIIYAQNPSLPCGNDYGSSADESNIVQQMRFGTIQNAVDAIDQAKNTRGFAMGCPQIAYNYNSANYAQPLLSDVENIWNNVHKPAIEAFVLNCPRIGRYENNAALGAYYANLAGYSSDFSVLDEIADMQEAQQYSSSNVANLDAAHEGVYGYIHVGSLNSCYPGGVVGSTVDQLCANIPTYCVDYDYGLFAGENFAIGDQYEPLSFYDGGMAYDHGWVGIQMIEAAIQQTDPIAKGKFKNSAELAGNWALNQEVVKNHNYSAKLIWLLAEMYLWTGDVVYKNELDYKLNKNLLPAVLMDTSSNGLVDGTSIAFSDLTIIAQIPGRCWDGHNSLPWYNAMNAWALTEAYVAFRDRGDVNRANELKPYVIAMLDNLSWEINNLGVIDDQLGVRDLTYALLIGIWKVARYENESHTNWETAAWAMWNTGYFNTYSTHSVCVGLYLCLLNNTAYEPLFDREPFDSIDAIEPTNRLSLYPNPTDDFLNLKMDNFYGEWFQIRIVDLTGRIILESYLDSDQKTLDLSELNAGSYTCTVWKNNKDKIYIEKFIIY